MSQLVDLGFVPRAYQREAHRWLAPMTHGLVDQASIDSLDAEGRVALDEQLELGRVEVDEYRRVRFVRFAVLVWHRRAGKTVFAIIELILAALRCRRRDGRFAYVAPFLKQAKMVAWDYLRRYALTVPGVEISESEHSVRFPNGATVRLFGADNPDSLRGTYFDGVVLDEVADMRPNVWGEIIRPALMDRTGWAVFIGTPKGVNLFSELFFRAQQEPGWWADMRRGSETGVLSQAELAAAKREMTASQYAQEIECDFAASADDVLLRLEDVQVAMARDIRPEAFQHSANVLGVDVARFGDDSSVIVRRQGLVAFQPAIFGNMSVMELAARVAQSIDRVKPDAVFIDAGGVGGGVIDRLAQLGKECIPVNFGGKPSDMRFANARAEMWWRMAEWVRESGSLPNLTRLQLELTSVKYTFRNQAGRLQLESKEDIRERLRMSPDIADALACTFYLPVMPKAMRAELAETNQQAQDFDPYR